MSADPQTPASSALESHINEISTQTQGRRIGLLLLLLLITASCLYPVLQNSFVWDDLHLLLYSASGETTASGKYVRLVPMSLLRALYQSVGVDPSPYHVANLTLHLGNTLFGFLFLTRTGLSLDPRFSPLSCSDGQSVSELLLFDGKRGVSSISPRCASAERWLWPHRAISRPTAPRAEN